MEQDHSWPRGRHGWNSDSMALGLREGDPQSPRRMHHSGSPSHKFRQNRPVWDDTVHDLASMRLTPAELARKLAARQSSNKVIARAQLLEQSRRPGSYSPNLPPSLAARLQAARQQKVDSLLAQSNTTLLASQKIRYSETRAMQDLKMIHQQRKPDGEEDTRLSEGDVRPGDVPRKISQQQDGGGDTSTTGNHDQMRASGVETKVEKTKSLNQNSKAETSVVTLKESRQRELAEDTAKQRAMSSSSRLTKDTRKPVESSHGAATRTSLDHTITMVVNTCRELWLQLEEERLTRERLQQQLQQQGNVITTLTAELLQIQDQQEAILREVSDARASGLWGVEGDLSGGSSGSTDGGDDLISTQTSSGRITGGRPSPQPLSTRHPQRSILRATRTIPPPHMRQPPPYQMHHQTARTHQQDSHLPPSHQSPHSPRPHQPPHSPRPHQPPHSPRPHQPPPPSSSTTPHQTLTFTAPLIINPHIHHTLINPHIHHALINPHIHHALINLHYIRIHSLTHHLYVHQKYLHHKIRDALVSEQCTSNVPDGKTLSTHSDFSKLSHEGSAEVKSSDKNVRGMGEKQAVAAANKENSLISVREESVMDSSIAELLEKKK
ncbi:histone acetyltransferase KAT6A-like [Homarus americanus]